MPSFIAIAHSYPKLYRGGGIRPPPPSQKSSKKPILNRVKPRLVSERQARQCSWPIWFSAPHRISAKLVQSSSSIYQDVKIPTHPSLIGSLLCSVWSHHVTVC